MNIGVLEAVIAAHREFQLFDRAIQVFILDQRLLFAAGLGLKFLFEINEDGHVVFEQLGGESQRIRRSDGAVGPDFNVELVVIGDLAQTRGLDRVIDFTYRGMDRIDGDEAQTQVFVEIPVGGNVAAAVLHAHFDLK